MESKAVPSLSILASLENLQIFKGKKVQDLIEITITTNDQAFKKSLNVQSKFFGSTFEVKKEETNVDEIVVYLSQETYNDLLYKPSLLEKNKDSWYKFPHINDIPTKTSCNKIFPNPKIVNKQPVLQQG